MATARVPDLAGVPFTEDSSSMAAAAGTEAPGGGPGPAVASGQALSPCEMAAAVQHTEAVKTRALAALVAPGTHDEHVQALLELRAAVAGLNDLPVAGAGRLLPAGVSVPIRKHLAVIDDRALIAAASAALAYLEETP